jgi:hypothetical protein
MIEQTSADAESLIGGQVAGGHCRSGKIRRLSLRGLLSGMACPPFWGGCTNPWPEGAERPTNVHSTPTRGIRNSPAPALLFSLEDGKPCAQSGQADPATAEYATTMDYVLSVVLTTPREDELANLRAPLKHYPRLHQPLFRPILITRLSLISQPSHTDDLGRTQISTAADAQVDSSKVDSSRVDRSIRSWRTLLELASSPKPRVSPKASGLFPTHCAHQIPYSFI